MEKELNEREADRQLHQQYKDMYAQGSTHPNQDGADPNLNKMHKKDNSYTDKRLNKLVNQYKTDITIG